MNVNKMDLPENQTNPRPRLKTNPGCKQTGQLNKEPLKLDENVYINEHIAFYLKDYQVEGVRFLYSAFKERRGAILADEMGLGKTIQVIAFLAAVLNKKGIPSDMDNMLLNCIKKQKKISDPEAKKPNPFLICCPASVISNWMSELETWGYFAANKFHSMSERKDTIKRLENSRCEIVVTSHETARVHIDELTRFEWSAVIVDEFHKIKNDDSLVSNTFHEFTTKTRIGLSGTILQNSLIELWTLLDWANPGCLGSKDSFRLNYCKPILLGQRQNATKAQLLQKVEKTNILKRLKKQWVLRRTKQIISNQLPKKDDQVVYCKLSEFQIDLIKRIRNTELVEFVLNRNKPCKCGGTYYTKDCNCYRHLAKVAKKIQLKLVSVFLKIANHPALFLEGLRDDDELDRTFMNAISDRRPSEFTRVHNCGKMRILEALLSALHRQNTKVLLFSYSVRLLDIIEKFATDKKYSFLRLDGQTKTSTRHQLVNNFNQDPNIFLFLISTKAGGVGLNITGANVVIIFDPNWNPTHDIQAQDRAYRIGQNRDVHVYRLISSGCIEENIYLRQIYKTHLSKECVEDEDAKRLFFVSSNNKKGEFLGIENLFGLEENTEICKTRQILKRYSAIERGIAGLEVSKFVETEQERDESQEIVQDQDEYFYSGDESLSEESDEDETEQYESGDDSYENLIGKVLSKKDVVHMHQNKDVCTSSKIETHVRKCIQEEASSSKTVSNQNAFDCNVIPQLSTLDYVELDLELTNTLNRNKESKFELSDGSFVHYGNVPNEIKREQFKKMAERLKLSVEQLAATVINWTSEERFSGMKRFYLSLYPKSKEFYESFSKLKRKLTQSDAEQTTNKLKKQKSNFDPDYYENLNTFENYLGVLEDETEVEDCDPPNKPIETCKKDEIDSLFERFMTNTKEIDFSFASPRASTSSGQQKETIKLQSSDLEKDKMGFCFENEPKFEKSRDSEKLDKDKYEKLLDELFN